MNLFAYFSIFHCVKCVVFELQNKDKEFSYKDDVYETDSSPSLISCTLRCQVIDASAHVHYHNNLCTCLKRSVNEEKNLKKRKNVFSMKNVDKLVLSKWTRVIDIKNAMEAGQGKMVAFIPKRNAEYKLSFDVYNRAYTKPIASVIQLSNAHRDKVDGARIPAVWMSNGKLYVFSNINFKRDGFGHEYTHPQKLSLNKWFNVEIRQEKEDDGLIYYMIAIDKVIVHRIVNKDPREFLNVKCYISSPYWRAKAVSVRNLKLDLNIFS